MLNGFFLFGLSGGVSWAELQALPLGLKAFLLAVEVAVPLLGNFRSRYVSFLPGHRYYAGNWPISVWIIKRSARHKLSALPKPPGVLQQYDQCWSIYGCAQCPRPSVLLHPA